MDRAQQLLHGIDKSMRGAEISPFYAPIAPKAEGWNTLVVSNSDGESQRRAARSSTAEAIRERVNLVEDVDVIWTSGDLAEACLAVEPEGFDYIIASHVIEHVPDLLGLLLQFERMITPSGVISLAVPDLRREFDFFRFPSDTADVFKAHLEKRLRHSPETMFRHHGLSAAVDGLGAWTRSNPGVPQLCGQLTRGYQRMLEQALYASQADAAYRDAHAWTFVPASFKLILYELRALQITSLDISFIELNEGSEFVTQLRHSAEPLPNEQERERVRQALLREIIEELSNRPFRPI